MNTNEKLQIVVKALDSKKAKDLKVIKIDDITNILFNPKPEDNKIPKAKESKLHKLFDEFIKKENYLLV